MKKLQPTSHSMVKSLNIFPLKSGIKHGCLFLPLLFDEVLLLLATTIRQEKEVKDIQIGMEDIKLPLLREDLISYVENPKDHTNTHTHTELINEFSKTARYKSNTKISVAFLYTMNNPKREINKSIQNNIEKNKIPRNKFNQGGCYRLYFLQIHILKPQTAG